MSDLQADVTDLDRLFDDLARRASARGHRPGAAAAVSAARRRRRTRVGGVALAAVLVVGGGLGVPWVLSSEDGVAANGSSAPLDADALEAATQGWTSGWEMWERFSPKGGGSYGIPECSTLGTPQGDPAPTPESYGTSRFVADARASGVLVLQHFADDGQAASSQDLSNPPPGTCGETTFYEVDGVRVRHDSMPQEDASEADLWLGDVWSARLGADRAQLEVVSGAGVADDVSAERVAQALVAGLRDGWTQSGALRPDPPSTGKGELPEWGDVDLVGALGGWRAVSEAAATADPNTPCLDEPFPYALTSSSGGTGRGVTWRVSGFDDETSGPSKVADMVEQLRRCTDAGMRVETLPNGVHLATYDTGGGAGAGALWFAAAGDRAGLVGVDGADRPMPAGAREDVADALHAILQLPWE